MNNHIIKSKQFRLNDYDEIIDVRSPDEYREDHIPGAINLPVLSNQERALVGTIYTQNSPFEANKEGAAIINANIVELLRGHFIQKPKSYRPLVYCWRGGKRSGSLALILDAIGWRVTLLEGGYKYYRSTVRDSLDTIAPLLNLCVLSGLTGTAKTRILTHLEQRNEQVIDLEGLANHKGSLLGQIPDKPQPAQKYFESLLSQKITSFNHQNVTWIESESSKVGNLHIPQSLWKNMKSAAVVEIQASIDQRCETIIQDYPWFTEMHSEISHKLSLLTTTHGQSKVDEWQHLIDNQQWKQLVHSLLQIHYDPGYSHSMSRNERRLLASINLDSIDQSGIATAASRLIALQSTLPKDASTVPDGGSIPAS